MTVLSVLGDRAGVGIKRVDILPYSIHSITYKSTIRRKRHGVCDDYVLVDRSVLEKLCIFNKGEMTSPLTPSLFNRIRSSVSFTDNDHNLRPSRAEFEEETI